jgi:hypothetical protein
MKVKLEKGRYWAGIRQGFLGETKRPLLGLGFGRVYFLETRISKTKI